MKRTAIAALVAVLMLTVGVSAVRAEEKPKKGTVEGVVSKEGKPVEGVRVALMKPPPRPVPPPGVQRQADGGEKPAGPPPDGGGGRGRIVPVAETTTDADGKYSLTAEAGEYMLVASLRRGGTAQRRVTLVAGENQEVDLALEDRPRGPGGPGGPGAGPPGQGPASN